MGQSRRLLEVLAIASMFAMTVSMYLVWAVAYVNDGSTTVFIDQFGEQFLELVLWTFVIPVVAIGLHSLLRRRRDGEAAAGETADGTESVGDATADDVLESSDDPEIAAD